MFVCDGGGVCGVRVFMACVGAVRVCVYVCVEIRRDTLAHLRRLGLFPVDLCSGRQLLFR